MDDVRVSRSCLIPASELRFRFSRSGGPGGQNVNRRDTRVELLFDVASSASLGPRQRARLEAKLANRIDSEGVLHVVASEERTQAANRAAAVERFGDLVREALKPDPPPRRKTKPTKSAKERRLKEKKERSRTKRERSWRPED
jgi:ribosome-associated protein